MAYSKKTWKDRITEYPNRRELTHSDSSTELVTVARSEGTISQEGDAFSAQNMNDLEGRIDSEFSAVDQNLQEINDKLTAENDEEFDFAYDETTQKYGFRVGGVFMPFTSVDYPEITKISEQQATTQTTQNFQLTAKRELIFMNSSSEGTAWSSSCTSSDATVTTIAKWEGTYRQDYAIYQIEGEIGDAYTVSFNRGNCNIVRLLVN